MPRKGKGKGKGMGMGMGMGHQLAWLDGTPPKLAPRCAFQAHH